MLDVYPYGTVIDKPYNYHALYITVESPYVLVEIVESLHGAVKTDLVLHCQLMGPHPALH